MMVSRRPLGVYYVCVKPVEDGFSCSKTEGMDNVRTGTVDDLSWLVHSGYTDVAWEPEMTPDWQGLEWVAQNENRPGR